VTPPPNFEQIGVQMFNDDVSVYSVMLFCSLSNELLNVNLAMVSIKK
jgi:hypothetical protein